MDAECEVEVDFARLAAKCGQAEAVEYTGGAALLRPEGVPGRIVVKSGPLEIVIRGKVTEVWTYPR